jgi:glutamyl-tRNA reductase
MIFVIGIDHKSAPLEVREALYQRRSEILHFWKNAFLCHGSVLVTCNRVEVYGDCADEEEFIYYINAFRKKSGQSNEQVYQQVGLSSVLKHALSLACGLKSQLLGETQIMDQLRRWKENSLLPFAVRSLWDKALAEAGHIRLKSGLDNVTPTIATIVFNDLQAKKALHAGEKIVVIGTGIVAELIAREFAGFVRIHFIARKNRARARWLADITGGSVYDPRELRDILSKSTVIISATASPHYIITQENCAAELRSRTRPLYLYDLSVPRDVEPAIGAHACVRLQDLDGLGPAIEENNKARAVFGARAVALIDEFIEKNSNELAEALS